MNQNLNFWCNLNKLGAFSVLNFILFMLITVTVSSQSTIWSSEVVAPIDNGTNAIAIDENEEFIYIVGYFDGGGTFTNGTDDFDLIASGGKDGYLTKLDVDGNIVWMVSIGSNEDDELLDVCVGPDGNIYATGYISENAHVQDVTGYLDTPDIDNISGVSIDNPSVITLKFDTEGNFIWHQVDGSEESDYGISIAPTEDGIIVFGSFNEGSNSSGSDGNASFFDNDNVYTYGRGDLFLMTYNTDGEGVWFKTMGSDGIDFNTTSRTFQQQGLGLDYYDGKSYIHGSYDNDNMYLSPTQTSASTGALTTSIEAINSANDGTLDSFAACFTQDGGTEWITAITTSGNNAYGYACAADCDGVYIGGHASDFIRFNYESTNNTYVDLYNNDTFYTAKLDLSDGMLIWYDIFYPIVFANDADHPFNTIMDVDTDEKGNIYFAEMYESYTDSEIINIATTQYDHNGNLVNFVIDGDSGFDAITDVLAANNGIVYTVGQFEESNSNNLKRSFITKYEYSITEHINCCAETVSAGQIVSDNYFPCEGSDVYLASDPYQGAIQWQYSENGGSTWMDIPGANSSNLNYMINTDVIIRTSVSTSCGEEFSNQINLDMQEVSFTCPPSGINSSPSVGDNCMYSIPDYLSTISYSSCYNLTQTPAPGEDVGFGIQTITFEDSNYGLVCSFEINVIDDTAPIVFNCNDINVPEDESCAYLVPNYLDLGITISENCGYTVVQSPEAGTELFDDQTVLLTVTDDYGNSNNCNFEITLNKPFSCPSDISVEANTDCQFIAEDYRSLTGVCDIDQLEQHPFPGNPMGVGINQVEFQDLGSGDIVCTFVINVLDSTAPTVDNCPTNFTFDPGTDCSYTIPDFTSSIIATDACGIQSITQSIPEGNTIYDDETIVITVTDNSGNTETCTFDIDIIDTTAPEIDCGSALNFVSDADVCGTNISVDRPSFIGECQQEQYSLRFDQDNQDHIAINNLIYEGVYSEVTVDVWIRTDENDQIIASFDQSEYWRLAINSSGNARWSLKLDTGVTLVLNGDLNVADGNWHQITCIYDNGLSAIYVDGNLDVSTNEGSGFGSGDKRYGFIGVGSEASEFNGNKGPMNYYHGDIAVFKIYEIALTEDQIENERCETSFQDEISLHYRLEEGPGNSEVYDYSNQANTGHLINLDPTSSWNNTFAFNCTDLTHDIPLDLFYPVGNNEIIWTATDINGNESSCTQTVIVEDLTAPISNCPESVDIELIGNCDFIMPDLTALELNEFDNCGILSMTQDLTFGTTYSSYDYSFATVTFEDVNTNSSTCEITLNFIDNILPEIICPDTITVSTNTGCGAQGVSLGTVTINDNCSATELLTVQPLIYPLGFTNIIRSVEDDFGNVNTCTQTIEVIDDVLPTIICPGDISQGTDAGQTFATVSVPTPSANDNCSIDYFVNDYNGTNDASDTYSIGTHTITWTVYDSSGNSENCEMTITISDDNPPVITCPENITSNNTDGSCETYVSIPPATATDNGVITSITNDYNDSSDASDTYPVGTTVVIWTAIDSEGNWSSCSMSIEILDNEKPTIDCPGDVTIDAGASCSKIVPDFITGRAIGDNCTIYEDLIINQEPAAGTIVGEFTDITISVTDENGNTEECEFILHIQDTTPPDFTCISNQNIELSYNCDVILPDYTNQMNPSDNCDDVTGITVQQNPLPGTVIGENTNVTITITDSSNNQSVCSFDVIVFDNSKPFISAAGEISYYYINTSDGIPENSSDFENAEYTDNTVLGILGESYTPTENYSIYYQAYLLVEEADNYNFELYTHEGSYLYIDGIQVINNEGTGDCNAAYGSINLDLGFHKIKIIQPQNTPTTCLELLWENSLTSIQNIPSDQIFTFQNYDLCLPDDQLIADENCQAAAPDYTASLNAFDNCTETENLIITQDPLPGTIIYGDNLFTLTISDESSNVYTCQFNVSVNGDNIAPTISTCYADHEESLDENCNFEIGDYTDCASISDNCDTDPSISQSPSPGTIVSGHNNVITITLTAEDNSSNEASISFDITLKDITNPTIICPNDISQVSDSENCGATIVSEAPTTGDNCGINSISNSFNGTEDASDFYPIGSTQVTWTVMDFNGNENQCIQTIHVLDLIQPEIICGNDTLVSTSSLSCDAYVELNSPEVTDNCTAYSLTNDFNNSNDASATYPLGITNILWTATDQYGNGKSCLQKVNVVDSIDPTIICGDDISQFVSPGSCAVNIVLDTPQIDDNCSTNSLSNNLGGATLTSGTFPIGSTTIEWTVTDNASNFAKCYQDVTIIDNLAPEVICDDTLRVGTDIDGCLAFLTLDPPTGEDNCQFDYFTNDYSGSNFALGLFPVDTTIITWTGYDIYNNSASCDQVIIVSDLQNPEITCPDNSQVSSDLSCGFDLLDYSAEAVTSDNCSSLIEVSQFPAPSSFVTGTTEVILTGTDESGNSASCSFEVQVVDITPPMIINCVPDSTIYLDSNCEIEIPDLTDLIQATDNCDSDLDIIQIPPSGTLMGHNDSVLITFEVRDDSDLLTSCSMTLTAEDNTAPEVTCQDYSLELDENGLGSISVFDILNELNEECNILSQSLDIYDFDCDDVGENTVQLTVINENNLEGTCTSTVNVSDPFGVTAICQNLNLELDASGLAMITEEMINNGSSAVCSIQEMNVNPSNFDCSSIGDNDVTLTVIDYNGQEDFCNAIVSISNPFGPVAECQDLSIDLDISGTAMITPEMINNGSSAICGIQSVELDITSFDCSNLGTNEVILTVTDQNNDTDSCPSTITIIDPIGPAAACQNISVELDESGDAIITPELINNESIALCGIQSMELNVTTFDCSNVGANNVILTITDQNNVSDSCPATVTVVDPLGPIAECQNLTIQLDNNGEATITADMINNGSIAVCGLEDLAINNDTFDCSNLGTNEVILTVTDQNDEVSTCLSTVTIQDLTDPIISCYTVVSLPITSESVVLDFEEILISEMDACGIDYDSVVLSEDTFTSDQFEEEIFVELSISDNSGNEANCISEIVLIDEFTPTALCHADTTLYLDINGSAFLNAMEVDSMSFDNGDLVNYELSQQVWNCESVGLTETVILTVTDDNNNQAQCATSVTILDDISPSFECLNPTISLSSDGLATVLIDDLIQNSFDNCSEVSYDFDSAEYECFDINTDISITIIGMDEVGNEHTCVSNITIVDDLEPEILYCPNEQEFFSSETECGNLVHISDIDVPTAMDNCGLDSIYSVELNQLTGTEINFLNLPDLEFFLPVDNYTLTWTLQDNNGNNSYCTSTIVMIDDVIPTLEIESEILIILPQDECLIDYGYVIEPDQADDNCEINFINPGQSYEDLGSSVVFNLATADDVNGNSIAEFLPQFWYIVDTVAPVIECEESLVFYSEEDICGKQIQLDFNGTVTDNCPETISIPEGIDQFYEVGTHQIEWTAYDFEVQNMLDLEEGPFTTNENGQAVFNGNEAFDYKSSCLQTITVLDTFPPVVIDFEELLYVEIETNSIDTFALVPEVTDNCEIISITSDWTNNEINYLNDSELADDFPLGSYTINWTITDLSGNEIEVSTEVEIIDLVAPVFENCPEIFEVSVGNSCDYNVPEFSGVFDIIEGTNEFTITQTPEAGTGPFEEETEVIITATDGSDNSSECTFTLTPIDITNPVIECEALVASCEALTLDDLPTFTDNCAVEEHSITVNGQILDNWSDLIDFPYADTLNILYEAMDEFENIGECQSQVIFNIIDFQWEDLSDHICQGDNLPINVSNEEYSWTTSLASTYIDEGVYYADVDSDQEITDEITLTVCQEEYTQEIEIHVIPEPSFDDLEWCSNEEIHLMAGVFPFTEVTWDYDQSLFSVVHGGSLSPTFILNQNISDTVITTISLLADNYSCVNTFTSDLIIYANPETDSLDAGPDQFLFDSQSTYLDGVYNGSGDYFWTLTDDTQNTGAVLDESNELFTNVEGIGIGLYEFVLNVENGVCNSIIDTVSIDVNGQIPNGFSPNENGKNDNFVIPGLDYSSDSELIVFNRWGSEVYRKRYYDNSWNGRNKNGESLVDDTYFYVFTVGQKKYEGFVVIKRN